MRHLIWSASMLAGLRPGHDPRPALDEVAALGFNAVRVFAGRLSWANQSPADALARLPWFLTEAHARGLNVDAVALTDTKDGDREAYPRRAHATAVGQMLTPFDVLTLANEPWHTTQLGLDPAWLASIPTPQGVIVALGAAEDDESPAYAAAGGHWVTAHLDRGRDVWNMVRRVRELLALSEASGRPVLSSEPIGADEQDSPGRRCANPSIFYTMGALGQLMGVSTCFHSQAGLWADRLGPRQRECAQAFIRGVRAIPAAPYTYKNATHDDSPVENAEWNEGRTDRLGCTRAYSGVTGDRGYTVVLGIGQGGHGVRWGWAHHDLVSEMPNVQIYRVGR